MHPHRTSGSLCAQSNYTRCNFEQTTDLSQQRCLLIKHSDGWHNEQWLDNHGASVETIICSDGSTLPDPDGYSRVIRYGGQSCVNSSEDRRVTPLLSVM